MSSRNNQWLEGKRLRNPDLSGYEPAPINLAVRLSYYPWLVVGATCIGAFIGQLDASIVQLALPALEREFDGHLSSVSWVAIAYLLAFASLLPIFARLSEMFGQKLLYLAGYVIFTLASALCGLAPNLRLLILFRLVQGAGGALLGANSITILIKTVGPQRRGRALGIFAAAQAVGISAGPVVGGVLLSTLGWRWVFWVAVPFGLAGVIVGWLLIPRSTDLTREKRFDWWGAALLIPAITSMVLVLSEFHAWGPRSIALLSAAIAAIFLLPLFVWRELRAQVPLIDLHLFRSRWFTGGVIAVNLCYALLYSMFFLMSFAFIRSFHQTPIEAGVRLAIIPVTLGLTAPLSGALYERVGMKIVTTAGMALCTTGVILLWLSLGGGVEHNLAIMGALALLGVGVGLFITPNNSAVVAAAPSDRRAQAGGLLSLIRVLGCTLGIATASTTLSWRLHSLAGSSGRTIGVPSRAVLAAVHDVLWILAALAIIAAGAALLRDRPENNAS